MLRHGPSRVDAQAISAAPHMGALYGNRAACWMMLKQYTRAIDDCSEGLKLEKDGDLYKVGGGARTS